MIFYTERNETYLKKQYSLEAKSYFPLSLNEQ